MKETEFKALMHCGQYVDANLLEKGIYTCSKPFICDVCDCEHDMNYKCEKCSYKAYIDTYEDVFGDITSEWVCSGDVCGNCCNCT